MKKKCFLYAYDKQNLGDDLFIHTITKRYPKVKFYMWTDGENRNTFRCLPNLKVVDKDSRFVHALKRIRASLVPRYRYWLENRCNAVVYIGGSIFMECKNWEQNLRWWEHESQTRPLYVLGANFGPYQTEAYREKASKIYGNMQDICFRDQYSYDLFSQVPTVRQAPDILFSHPMPRVLVKEKQIFVSVIDCAGRKQSHGFGDPDRSYVEQMGKMLQGYLDRGYSLVMSSFCKEEGDETAIGKILGSMGCENDPRIRILCYDGTNAEELTCAIAESEAVIASRFHAAILAIAAGRPVLPVVYSDKTIHVLQDLGFEGTIIDLRSQTPYQGTPAKPNVDLKQLAQEAQKHFEKLDGILC